MESQSLAVAESIYAAITEMETLDEQRRIAAERALGMWMNHETHPTVGVIVWMGKVSDIKITDEVTELPPEEITYLVGFAIINAYVMWYQHYRQLMGLPDIELPEVNPAEWFSG